jgi:hypothetical protein
LTTVGDSTLNPIVQVLVVAEVPAISAEDDREMTRALGFADGSAVGCRFRLSGPRPGGGRRIMTLWETREAYETWRDDRLATVLQATGNPIPLMDVWEIDESSGF